MDLVLKRNNSQIKRGKVPAVVIGLDQITGLNTVWSLALRKIPVFSIIGKNNTPYERTRKCRKIRCENVNSNQLINTLLKIGKNCNQKLVLIPTTDPQVELISEFRDLLKPYYLFELPEKRIVKILLHKTKFTNFALDNGINIPQTFIINKKSDYYHKCNEIKYPCILKPYDKTSNWDAIFPNDKILKIAHEKDILDVLPKVLGAVKNFIIQEWIEGPDSQVYFCLLYFNQNSELKASFVGKKIRQWYPEIGSTAVATMEFNQEILEESIRLFKMVKFKGFGSVEYKFDHRDKNFKIIEPTVGRPNLQSFVSVINGVNIPYIAYRNLVGENSKKIHQPDYKNPTKWINEWSDYESARFYMKRGDLNLLEWIKSIRGPKRFALWSVSDPLPFLYSLFCRVKGKLKKILSGLKYK
jgi:predicted ATP-grasp superfamily ATP-dependent carboligase